MTTITINRATVEQALEALETCDAAHPSDGGQQWYDEKLVEPAITALRAALAQQAEPVEPITRLFGTLPVHDAQQAEPVEPVGWNWMLDGQPYGQAYYGNPPDTDIAERAAIAGRTVRLLYAAPPKLLPLTEGEIEDIYLAWDVTPGRRIVCLVRTVERALEEKNRGR